MDSFEPRAPAEDVSRGPSVIVIGGGKGGAGKSLLSVNLAVYLAQLGKRVTLVDADETGSNLHVHLGILAPLAGSQGSDPHVTAIETDIPGLSLLGAPHDAISPTIALRATRRMRVFAKLRAIPADFVIVHAGPGHAPSTADALLGADLPITVTVPEPPAIEATYRLLRVMYRRLLRREVLSDRFRMNLVERALREQGTLPSPVELVRALSKMDPVVAELAWAVAARVRAYLVVNQVRARGESELGSWMSQLALRHQGTTLLELGHIEHDDGVWATVRQKRPLLTDNPACKAARSIERLARRCLALLAKHETFVRSPMPLNDPDFYTLLGVTRSSADEEVRRAFKRQREAYQGHVAAHSLVSVATQKRMSERLAEAHDTILDPVRRRAYDLSTFASEQGPIVLRSQSSFPPPQMALRAEQLAMAAELAREIGPDTIFTGELLRRVRESRGIELEEIAARTKIAKAHLVAIENDAYATLPASVYVRGFLGELAKCLDVDVAQVQRSYLRRMREAPKERPT